MIGTAGWSIARHDAAAFPAEGTVLERYSRTFDAVEVNSSFYRAHRPQTWERWAASTPGWFRFSVKVPRAITHHARLIDVDPLIARFAGEVTQLGSKLGVLLVQLPPGLRYDASVAERFFTGLRDAIDAEIACEPRNATWFTGAADAALDRLRVARVAADPAPVAAAAAPGGWRGLAYWRLHGSPAMYHSPYDTQAIARYAERLRAETGRGLTPWCIFDNTAAFAATGNALSIREFLHQNVAGAPRAAGCRS
ncbi:DUF72 domain-containing protein [Sphingomonas sp. CL5.1]|uniref:DUF72 domain-containing protein n=1 Tax=Sphingomonas sp. CL5.1 TaxID=2653203 RepID=UPI0020C5EB6A|nr:DUF72 domain-containing protein [Sphingomonas sp. CL5.1]